MCLAAIAPTQMSDGARQCRHGGRRSGVMAWRLPCGRWLVMRSGRPTMAAPSQHHHPPPRRSSAEYPRCQLRPAMRPPHHHGKCGERHPGERYPCAECHQPLCEQYTESSETRPMRDGHRPPRLCGDAPSMDVDGDAGAIQGGLHQRAAATWMGQPGSVRWRPWQSGCTHRQPRSVRGLCHHRVAWCCGPVVSTIRRLAAMVGDRGRRSGPEPPSSWRRRLRRACASAGWWS